MKYLLTFSLVFTLTASAYSQNTWVQRDSVNGSGKSTAAVFALNDDAYLLTGLDQFSFKRSMYSYDLSQDDWDDELSLGGISGDGLNRGSAIAFSAGGYGFCGLGTGSVDYFKDLWRFDPVAQIWTQMADFEGEARREAVAFVIDNTAYVGTGQAASGLTNDFYAYDYLTNDWAPIQSFPGTARRDAVGFNMGGQGYVGTGIDATTYKNDFWSYYPITDTWIQRADFPGTPRHGAVGFGLFPTAFIALGEDNTFTYKKDLWEYNYFGDSWTQRTNFPSAGRAQAFAIVVNGRAFVGTGYSGAFHDDFYEYIPLLSIDEKIEWMTNVYPNPTSDYFTVNLKSAVPNGSLKIINEVGQDISSSCNITHNSATQFQIDVSTISSGLYYVCILDNNVILSTKSILIK